MNTNDNKADYHKNLSRIERLKLGEKENIHLDTLRLKLDILLEELRSDEDARYYSILYTTLCILVLLAMISSALAFGVLTKIGPILILILLVINRRIKLQKAIRKVMNHKLELDKAEKPGNYFLKSKIEYVLNGIKLKMIRLHSIRLLYTLFFPLFTFYLTELIKGQLPFKGFWISILLAYLIAGVPWFFYFRQNIVDLQLKEEGLIDHLELMG